ncbi:zf-HC2 domain-containing protein [Actinomycetes bacterium KLBMP 9797]
MRCDYEYDSGAYVLGALSPGERAGYERHLAGCTTCREAVGDVAVLPGLLGRLDPAGLETIASAPPSESRMPQLLTAVAHSRRRERAARRWRTAGTALAAACLALFVGLGAGVLREGGPADPTPQVQLVSMNRLASNLPIDAEIGMRTTDHGTEITMHCVYPKERDNQTYTYGLVAYSAAGEKREIGSWKLAPGADATFTSMSSWVGKDLKKLVLVRKDGTPLMDHEIP